MKRKAILTAFLLLLVLGLAACTQSTGQFNWPWKTPSNTNNQFAEYFTGTEGVNMRFSDSASPPPLMYYYASNDPDENAFFISVDVQNVGSSWSRGALFVSGYDPYMVRIQDIDIPRLQAGWQDCIIDFGIMTYQGAGFFDSFVGQLDCDTKGFDAYTDGPNSWGIGIKELGDIFGDGQWWSDIGFSFEQSANGPSFGMNVGDDINFDYLNRGQGMLILLSGLNFQRYNGFEYLLHPDDYDFPGGEMDTIVFEGQVRNWPRGLDSLEKPIPFIVTNCFTYATYAAPQVCIDPAPFGIGDKACRPREITFNGGNGAPVAVTTIRQENSRNTVYFTITVKNVDNGQVFDMGYMERCSPYYPGQLRPQHLNKVYLLDARIGNQHLRCSPERWKGVRLNDRGEGTVLCRYDLEYQTAKSAYETPLVLEFGYGYSQSIRKTMQVKRTI